MGLQIGKTVATRVFGADMKIELLNDGPVTILIDSQNKRIRWLILPCNKPRKKVDQWIRTYGVRYFNELTNMTILTEEVGELAGSWHAPTVNNRSKKATKTAI